MKTVPFHTEAIDYLQGQQQVGRCLIGKMSRRNFEKIPSFGMHIIEILNPHIGTCLPFNNESRLTNNMKEVCCNHI